MKRCVIVMLTLVCLVLAFAWAGAQPQFKPVTKKTRPLTMTGMKQDPVPEEPRGFQFQPVTKKTKVLTMTGMRD